MFSGDPDEDLDTLVYIHDQIIEASGGVKGFHSKALIQSALARPLQTVMGEDAYGDVYTKAAALLDSIANNHGFRDGNKRSAMAAAIYYLDLQSFDTDFTNDEYESFMLHVVNDKPSVQEISQWLREHSTHIPPTQWTIADAYDLKQRHPDTFDVPPDAEVADLEPGSIVKLNFIPATVGEAMSERMWVEIVTRQGDTYTGTLSGDAATIRGLVHGDAVSFMNKNIFDIYQS